MGRPPLLVRYLQNFGIILSHSAHQRHHDPPWIANYCITTGWCNRPLQAIQFFRRFERLITHVTGLQARSDEHQFGRSISGKQS
jgi:ubiquitin-conjugating enzyme E2 variant